MQEKYRRRLLTALLAILAAAALALGALGLSAPGSFRTAHADGETVTPPEVGTDFTLDDDSGSYVATYTGSALAFFASDESEYYTIVVVDEKGRDVGNSAADAGTYTATVTLTDEAEAWEDESTDPLTYTFVIGKATITAPAPGEDWEAVDDNTYEMTVAIGESATFLEEGAGYTLAGTLSADATGTYTVVASLDDPYNYAWETGGSEAIVYTFVLTVADEDPEEAVLTIAGDFWTVAGYTYTASYEAALASTGSVTFIEASDGYEVFGENEATEAGTYTVVVVLSEGYAWTGAFAGADDVIAFTFIIEEEIITPVAIELTINSTFTQDGSDPYTYTAAYEDALTDGEITFIAEGEGYDVFGENTAAAAGTYTVVVVLSEGYAWTGAFAGAADVIAFTFTIEEEIVIPVDAEIAINTAFEQTDTYSYSASYEAALASTGSVTFIEASDGYEVFGENTAAAAGTYTVVVVLSEGYAWTGAFEGAADVLTFTFTIEEEIVIPVEIELAINEVFTQDEDDPYSYSASYETAFAGGDSVTLIYAGTGYEIYGDTAATAAGSYSVVIALEDGYCWPEGFDADGDTVILTFTFVIDEKKPLEDDEARVTAPAAKEGRPYTYTGEAIEFEFEGELNGAAYTVYGGTQTEAGTYIVYVVLNEEYYWDTEDGTVSDKHAVLEFTFTIEKAEVEIPEIGTWVLDDEGEVIEGEGPFVYDGGVYTARYDGLDWVDGKYTFIEGSGLFVIYGDAVASGAGTYTVFLALADPANTTWADGGDYVLEFTFRIVTEDGVISAPIVTKTSVEWAESITLVTLTDEQRTEYAGRVEIYGNELDGREVEPGETYLVTFRLTDPENNYWSDLTTGDKMYTFTIIAPKTKVSVTAPDADTNVYSYVLDSDGNPVEHTYVIAEDPDGLYTVEGNVQSLAGTYYVAVVLTRPDLYAWDDGEGGQLEGAIIYYTFVIEKQGISPAKPTTTTYTYDGREKTFMLSTSTYTVTGDVKGTDAGSYAVALELVDPDNYRWATGAQTTYVFVIEKAKVTPDLSGTATSYVYTGRAVTFVSDTDAYYAAGAVTGTDAGTYVVTLVLRDAANYEWAEGADTTLTFEITKGKVAAPSIEESTYVYTGEEYVFLGGYTDTDLYYAQGAPRGTHAGTYEITLVLRDAANYEWESGAKTTFTFVIERASNSVTTPRMGLDGYAVGSAADFGTVIYRYYTDAACTKEVTSIVEPGTYYVRAEVDGTDDFEGAVSAALQFEVEDEETVSWSDILGIGSSALLLVLLVICMIVIIRRKYNG